MRLTEANYKSIPIHSSKCAQLDARSFCQTLWNSFAFSLMFSNNGFPGRAVVKNPPANTGNARDVDLIPGSGRSPGGGKWQPTPVFLPGESRGQRSLAGYSPWRHKDLDMTA